MCIPNSGGINPPPVVRVVDEGDDVQGHANIVVDQDQAGYL